MDCFSVSIASGAILRRVVWRVLLLMAVSFGVFQGLMPLIGWLLTFHFQQWVEQFDHWIAFGLLLYLGVNMIRSSFQEEEEKSFNPHRVSTILTLSIATSIDALAVGISFVCMGLLQVGQLLYPITVIGICSFILSLAGSLVGIFFGRRYNFRAELLGGIVLIFIGVRVLFSHLGIW